VSPLDTLFAGSALLSALGIAKICRDLLAVPKLPHAPAGGDPRPSISVVIPVRNEGERVRGTLIRLLEQQDVELELILVDDRSSDNTGAIAREIAARDPRLRVVRIDTLPAGWLGKVHACEIGGRAARHEWLLFTDGDVWMEPRLLIRAIRHLEAQRADHLVIPPAITGQSFAAAAATAAFGSLLLHELARANRDSRRGAVGIGAFNLLRRADWEAIGGHARLRLAIVDDMLLGLLLRRAGRRTRTAFARHALEADWARTLEGVPRALEKNFFAQLLYSVPLALLVSAVIALIWALPLAGLLSFRPMGLLAFGVFALSILPAALAARRFQTSRLASMAGPLFLIVIPWAILRSTWITIRQGGVRWRDTFHSLAELRAAEAALRRSLPRA
jgi:glycosyltransferase involved in cell wall biosynthesis